VKPPREQIEKMLAEGYLGELTSMVCLGAALAVKRGEPGGLESIKDALTGESLTPDLEAHIKKAHDEVMEILRSASSSDLDHAIALYTAHLKAAGYSVEAGYDH
jgi:hypothetical protein